MSANSKLHRWSSRWVFILATTGAAVGLGNIWKFPYMVGMNGGGAFMLVYLLAVTVLGIPLMMAEALLGRVGESDPVSCLKKISQNYAVPGLVFFAWWGCAGLFIVLSFYSVLAGWSLAYFTRTMFGLFDGVSNQAIEITLEHFLASPYEMLAWHTLFLILTFIVSAAGLKGGLERATRLLMPALFLSLFLLVIYAAIVGDLSTALTFLFGLRFQDLSMTVVISALGHAFFTLALGAGAIIAYGSYAPESTRLSRAIPIIALLDTLVAILAGLAIFPIVFANHLSPAEGPTLIFQVFPISFSQMPGGQWIGGLFFLFLFIAAWTSSINLAEPIMAVANQRFGFSRNKTACCFGFGCWLLGTLCVLSFNWLSNWHPLFGLNFFELMTEIPDRLILPIGGIAFAIIVGWVLPTKVCQRYLPMRDSILFQIWYQSVRFVCPITIAVVLLSFYLSE